MVRATLPRAVPVKGRSAAAAGPVRERTGRDTGIEAIGRVPWGTHFCVFYTTVDDLVDLLVPYFATGLRDGERCMWVTSDPLDSAAAEAALRSAVPALDEARERGAIEIVPHTDWYLRDGVFDSGRVLDGWVEKLEDGLAAGFTGLRLTGNTFWLEPSMWRDFNQYEAAVNDVIGRYRMVAMCTYSLPHCDAREVMEVVTTHHFALIKTEGRWVLIEHSDRKRAAEEIDTLNRSLDRKARQLEVVTRELERFSSMISHDLKAPLRAIRGFSRILAEEHGDALDDDGRRLLRLVDDRTERMDRLIDDILAISRVSRSEPNRRPVDMNALVGEVVEELRELQPEPPVPVTVGDLDTVTADPRLLRQVWLNLLDNALKFTRGRPDARVTVDSETEADRVVFHVRDNGAGFDPRYAGRLFGPFQRLHGDEYPGTGVGLAVVSRIVAVHGGSVWAKGVPGRGAVFSFSLPRDVVATVHARGRAVGGVTTAPT